MPFYLFLLLLTTWILTSVSLFLLSFFIDSFNSKLSIYSAFSWIPIYFCLSLLFRLSNLACVKLLLFLSAPLWFHLLVIISNHYLQNVIVYIPIDLKLHFTRRGSAHELLHTHSRCYWRISLLLMQSFLAEIIIVSNFLSLTAITMLIKTLHNIFTSPLKGTWQKCYNVRLSIGC